MDQDTISKSIFFGAFYGVVFFLVYLSGRKIAPSLAVWFSVGSWVALMMVMLAESGTTSVLLFIPVVITSFFVFRQKADNSLQEFFAAIKMYKTTVVPEQVSKLLGSQYYFCAEGALTTQSGASVPYNWWQGMTSSTVRSGNATVTSFTYYLAVSFMPKTISEEFKRIAKAKMDTSGFTFRQKFRRWFVLDTETPIRIDETEDGSFVIIWQTYHDVQRFTSYINWLTANLQSYVDVVPVNIEPVHVDGVPEKADVKPAKVDVKPVSGNVAGGYASAPDSRKSSRYQVARP
jgi:hypothetical protein